jgi:hypothetical protein
MKGVAIERWPGAQEQRVVAWLTECSGPPTMDTWFIDQDYDLLTLVMLDELYTMYKLRWGDLDGI